MVLVAEVQGVAGVQPLHEPGQVRPPRTQQQVVMVRHQHVAKQGHVVGEQIVVQLPQEPAVVGVVEEDGPAGVPPRHHVVDGIGQFQAGRSGHGKIVRQGRRNPQAPKVNF